MQTTNEKERLTRISIPVGGDDLRLLRAASRADSLRKGRCCEASVNFAARRRA